MVIHLIVNLALEVIEHPCACGIVAFLVILTLYFVMLYTIFYHQPTTTPKIISQLRYKTVIKYA